MRTYRTSEVAKRCGIHPNTVRLYEELGLIPQVPRAGNGYRAYSRLHLEYVLLVRDAFQSTWLGGAIWEKALAVLQLSAGGHLCTAQELALLHLAWSGRSGQKPRSPPESLRRGRQGATLLPHQPR
ncbi:MAG: MerR family DNA-binding transcriptional regulator [Bacillota bacterium]